jgi:pSer/pThr/pTyr-binding forkhead associated (FHA) protein
MHSSRRSLLSPSPAELEERKEAERAGSPFLVYRAEHGDQRILLLEDGAAAVTIGRGDETDICLHWDGRVSEIHAEICPVGQHWAVVDDGLSRNGTYVNGERATARRRLRDGDQIGVGETLLLFREPVHRPAKSTVVGDVPV